MHENRLLISTLSLAGIVLLLVIGYSVGQWTTVTSRQNSAGGPGHRRQQAAQSGDVTRGGNVQSGQTALREGKLGQTEIAVFSNGVKKGGFTGIDVQKLKGLTIVTRHGLRKGWAVTDVLAIEGIKSGKEVIFTDDKNRVHAVTWEKASDSKYKLAFTYNNLGGLVVTSGIEVNETGVDKKGLRDLLQQAKQEKQSVFAPNIVQIEVKT